MRVHRVLVLGGGHAGLAVARHLIAARRPADRLEVALVSRETALVWHGLMPQIVSNLIAPQDALVSLRRALPGVTLYPYEVESINLDGRTVSLARGAERAELTVAFDDLVIALGSVTDFARYPGLTEHGLPMKGIGDAFHLRNHLIEMLELASAETEPQERRRLLTFVVAGAGFAGVEVACELTGLVRDSLRFYPQLHRRELRFVLISPGSRVLPALDPQLSARAQRRMRRWGIEVRLSTPLVAATANAAVVGDGERIPTRTLVATIGSGPSPVVRALGLPAARGRIVCDGFGRVPDRPGVWAVGDAAAIPDPATGRPFPETVTSADAEGRQVAANILATRRGTLLHACTASQLQVALLSRGYGLLQRGDSYRDGFLASLVWRGLFLVRIPSWHRRVTLLLDWLISSAFPRDVTEIRIARSDAILPMRFDAGETIVREGEPGSRFYVVTRGEVDVLRASADGEQVVGRLGPGQYFGELALLGGGRRSATVRAATDIEVLALSRQDFTALVKHLDVLRSSFAAAPYAATPALTRNQDEGPSATR